MTDRLARLLCAIGLAAGLAADADAQAQRPPAQPGRPAPRPAPRQTPAKPAPARPAPPAPPPPPRVPPDLRVVTRYTTGDVVTTSTAAFKGARARIELGADLASLQQCDLARTVQMNTSTRVYLATPFETAPAPGVGAPDAEAKEKTKTKGGLITVTTTVTETGETQDILGFTARRLKTITEKAASTDACDRTEQRVETDGWYVELPATLSCVTVPQPERRLQPDPEKSDCVDEITYRREGPASGFPLRYTALQATGSSTPVTTSMEVTEIVRVDVPDEAVDLPQDYVAVRSVRQLMADHRPGEPGAKKPGVVRVGVAPVSNRTDANVATDELSEALIETMGESDYDIVRLQGGSPDDLLADARRKDVDLILQNTITELRTPRGGVMGRLSGSANEAFTAKVEFALVAPGQSKPVYASSERSGASTLNRAIAVTRKLVQFAPPVLMAKYGFMNAYGSALNQGGAASGAMGQTGDPVMNTAFALLDRAAAKSAASEQYSSEEAAVASALEKEVRAVLGELGKKKK